MDRAHYYENHYLKRDTVGFEEKVVVPIKADNIMSILRNNVDTQLKMIMEVGCGEGYLSRELWMNFPDSLLIDQDLSFSALEKARSLVEGGTFLQSDAEVIPVKDDSLDLILLIDVLEHLSNPLLAMREALRSSRYVMLKVPLEKNVWGLAFLWVVQPIIKLIKKLRGTGKNNHDTFFNPHIHLFATEEIMRLINQAGGRMVFCKNTGYPWDPDFDEALEKVKIQMHRKLGLLKKFPRHYMFFNCIPFPSLRVFIKWYVGKISPDLYRLCFHTHLYMLIERNIATVDL